MRHTGGNRQHVARRQLVRVTAGDRVGAQLAIAGAAYADHLAAGDHGRGAVDDVHDVDGVSVVLDLAGRFTPAGVELVGAGVEQQTAGRELGLDASSAKNAAPFAEPFCADSASAPSTASSWSSSADEAPLTPTAPITWPSWTIGMPPWSGTARARCSAEARPPEAWSSKSLLGRR